jgi:asparagine synthetase B (glutamine-hydrolysing)
MGAIAVIVVDQSSVKADDDELLGMCTRLKHRARAGIFKIAQQNFSAVYLSAGTDADKTAGVQPARDEDQDIAVLLDGYLFDRAELARRWRLPTSAEKMGDADWIVQAYRQRGPGVLHQLEGSYAIVIHDFREHKTWLARDRMGTRALHLRRAAQSWWIASEEWGCLSARVPVALNPVSVERFLALESSVSRESYFAHVQSLAAGDIVCLQKGSLQRQTRPLPDWNAALHGLDFIPAMEEFQLRFERAVKRCLPVDSRCGISLSAGIDSGSVAAFALPLLRERGKNLYAYTFGFRDFAQVDETHILAEPVGALGIRLHSIFADNFVFPPSVSSPSTPLMNIYREIKQQIYAAAQAQQCGVILHGNFGDHLQADWHYCLHEAKDLADIRDFWRARRGRDTQHKWWKDPAIRFAVRHILRRGATLKRESQFRQYLGPAGGAEASLESFYSEAFGLDVRCPYRDPELAELMLSVKALHCHKRGAGKALVREAMRGRWPTALLSRPKSSDLTPVFLQRFSGELAAVRSSLEPVTELMQQMGINAESLIADVTSACNPRLAVKICQFLGLSLWQKRMKYESVTI